MAKWICPTYGLEYDRSVYNQVQGSRKSPFETGKVVVPGINDILTTHPHLGQIWNYALNDIDPETLSTSNRKLIWWNCLETSHPYQRRLDRQIKAGLNSPYMTSSKILSGYNDLATTHPEVIALWDFDKNFDTPNDVMPQSHKKRWWKLPNGTTTEREIRAIVKSKEKYLTLKNLGESYPEIHTIWDFEKNGKSPDDYLENEHGQIWVKCENGTSVLHEIAYIRKEYGT